MYGKFAMTGAQRVTARTQRTILAAFGVALGSLAVAGLIAAAAWLGPQASAGSSAADQSAIERALIEQRAGERELTPRQQAAAAERALIEHRAGEREPTPQEQAKAAKARDVSRPGGP
jgi:hypothetical protein